MIHFAEALVDKGAKVIKQAVFTCIRFIENNRCSEAEGYRENKGKNIWLKTVAKLSLPSLKTARSSKG